MSKYALVVTSYLLVGSLTVWAGKFQAHVDYPTAMIPTGVAVADFNGDGKPDLVASTVYDSVSVLLGNGDGTFQPHMEYGTGYLSEPFGVAVGDLNGDGKLDVVTANYQYGVGGSVSVLLGNGDGTFQTFVNYPTGGQVSSVAIGDLNGDGKPDLAVGDIDGTTVTVLLANGDGSFQAPVNYDTGSLSPLSVAIADFNGDGKADLVTANWLSAVVTVLLGKGDGTFPTHVTYATGSLPERVAVADFNGDRNPDLLVANSDSNSVSVLLGNGDGTFQPRADFPTSEFPTSLAVGDINRSSAQDVVVGNLRVDTITLLLGNGDGTLAPHAEYLTASCTAGNLCNRGVALGDFNGDRSLDIVAVNQTDNSLSVLMNTGGTFLNTVSSANPSKSGQPVTFTTTVTASIGSGRTPLGTVTFGDGNATIGTATLVNGQASLTISTLTVGNHTILARYSGNQSFNTNQAPPLLQTVVP